MKFTRKLVPALALLIVSAVLMTTATFAWFSMNTVATATGMQAEIEAADNVLIAAASVNDEVQPDDAFKTSFDLAHDAFKLNPVSSANGRDFFYVNTNRVNGGGTADGGNKFVSYENTTGGNKLFNDNYRTTGSVGYIDYDFQIMAINSAEVAQSLVLKRLALTYGGSDTIQPAFRVAVFVKEFAGAPITDAELVDLDDSTIKRMIYAPTYAAYNGGAASGATTVATPTLNSGITFSDALDAGETKYFRVLVRVWLEGQDESCTNKLFANLDDTWALDVAFGLGNSSVTVLGHEAKTITYESSYTIGTASQEYAQVIDGAIYYPVMDGAAQVAVGANVYLYTDTDTLTADTKFYTLTKDADYNFYTQPFDVTNQVILPTP